ncbi:LysR family transcriptional regulator [Parasphingorhabdus sp. JC815]|uniref:LysR family transcriptional regulator n=1 Tax=Parasphingorhabdus sp. JC815 TaxID=3232140 RepID=UPI0034578501
MSSWRGIEEFLAVVSKGSFTAAAEDLGLSKSFVSKLVNELEARLGVQLLVRNTRRLSLTAAGELFYDKCSNMQNGLQDVERQMQAFQVNPVGRLRIGLSDIFGTEYMSSLLAEFSEANPEIHIEPITYLNQNDIVQEQFDIVIRYGQLPDSSLKARLFGYLSYCLCASPEYVKEHGWPESIEDVANHQCLTNLGRAFEFNGGKSIGVNGRWTSNSGVALSWAVRRGLGLAHLPVSILREDLLNGSIVALEDDWSFWDRECWVVFSPGIMPASTRAFIDFLTSHIKTIKARPWMADRITLGK